MREDNGAHAESRVAGRNRGRGRRGARAGNFFSSDPNSQQQVYILAQQKIQTAAQQSPLLTEARKNTVGMLDGMLTSLGFQRVTVTFAGTPAG